LTNGHIREEDSELYALGLLPEEEAEVVKAHASACTECASKLSEALGRCALLALAVPQQTPPPAAKEKLFARIAAERKVPLDDTLVAQQVKRPVRPRWNWILVPASIALTLICLLLYWQNRKLVDELHSARLATRGAERDKQRFEDLARILASPDTVTIKLAGTDDAPRATGFVKYNGRLGVVLYSAEQLHALPAQKTYQMWLVPTNGAPISAGIFQSEDSVRGLLSAQVPANTAPKAFAVTIEPAGGVPQPTGPKLLLGAS
jgi:anti-sigma-K factor RskA